MLPPRFKQRVTLTVESYLAFVSPKMEKFVIDAINEKVSRMNIESPFRDVRGIAARADKAEAL